MSEFYTYLWLREDGTPYYVGKGSGNRAFVGRRHRVFPPKNVANILVQPYPCEEDAFFAERFLIDYYGRADLKVGCLRNLTDGGEGQSNPSEETRQKLRVAGKRNLNNGHMARIRSLGGKTGVGGKIGGKIGGRKNVESGHIQRLQKQYCVLAATAAGKKNVESGHAFRLPHLRWHVKRGIVNPDCNFCVVHHV
jgi:hypothetical protein